MDREARQEYEATEPKRDEDFTFQDSPGQYLGQS